jgi:hypothetical protein
MSKGKTRPDTFVTLTTGKKPLIAVTTITTSPPPSSFGSEEDKRSLAAKLRAGSLSLTTEERSFLANLVQPKNKVGRPLGTKVQSLRVAQYFICLQSVYPAKKHRKTIVGIVAETFGCGKRTVEEDIRYAKELDRGLWWTIAQRDPILPTWSKMQIIP